MTDAPAPDAPVPPPASPYGPADGVEQLFGAGRDEPAADTAPPVAVAAPGPVGDTEAVARARRTLKRLAIVLPIVGALICTAAIVVFVSTGGSVFGIDPISEIAGFTLTFLGPTLLVLGLHMVVWRALVRPLSRMTPGSRTGMIIGVGAALSLVSVLLVFIAVFAGFILLAGLLDVTGQAT